MDQPAVRSFVPGDLVVSAACVQGWIWPRPGLGMMDSLDRLRAGDAFVVVQLVEAEVLVAGARGPLGWVHVSKLLAWEDA